MKRRQLMMLPGAAFVMPQGSAQTQQAARPSPSEAAEGTPEKILLKDYRPQSIYKIPKTDIKKAKYPAIDIHCHGPRPIEALGEWVKIMDAAGVEKAVIFTGANSGQRFAAIRQAYSKYPGHFDLWCSFDFTGIDQPGFGPSALTALEDCHRMGALGVGEIIDKGRGFRGFTPGAGRAGAGAGAAARGTPPATPGAHPDDPRMDALWDKCAQLGMPINIHVSDPIWAYRPMDKTNDGLMNAWRWRIDDKQPGILGHDGLIESLERTAQKHRKTMFIASHLANLDYDLTRLGQMFDRHPNLYADISARFGETAPVPRFVNQFFRKYPGRVLYGTDMTYTPRMFSNTFRILESLDDHFYDNHQYHWPLYGFGLPDAVLKKVYRDNALTVFKKARGSAR